MKQPSPNLLEQVQNLTKELEKKLQDLEVARSELRSLNLRIDARGKRLARLDQDYKERKKFLEGELANVKLDMKKEIEGINSDIEEARKNLGELKVTETKVIVSIAFLNKEREAKLAEIVELEKTLEDKNKVVNEIDQSIEEKQLAAAGIVKEVGKLTDLLEARQEELESISETISAEKDSLKHFDEQFAIRRREAEEELKSILNRASKAADAYRNLKESEESILKGLADRKMALDKREEVVRKKEIKYADADNKVKEFSDFMKL